MKFEFNLSASPGEFPITHTKAFNIAHQVNRVGNERKIWIKMNYGFEISEHSTMHEFVLLVFKLYSEVFRLNICPKMVDYNGNGIVDPNGLGIPFDDLCTKVCTDMDPNLLHLIALTCLHENTNQTMVFRTMSFEHHIITQLQNEYLTRINQNVYQDIVDRMSNAANTDLDNDVVMGHNPFQHATART